MAVGKITILSPIKWGITWAITHPWQTIGGYLLLKNPYTRGWAIDHLILFGRGALAGARASSASTLTRLIIPAGAGLATRIAPVATRIGVGAGIAAPPVAVALGVVGTAGIISGGIVAAQQEVGLVGPDAPTMSLGGWLGEKYRDVQINPFMISMGTVV